MTPAFKPRADVLTAPLSDEAVLLDLSTKDYYRLNATAAAIWSGLERGLSRDSIETELCASFEVEPTEAADRAEEFLTELSRRGLIIPA